MRSIDNHMNRRRTISEVDFIYVIQKVSDQVINHNQIKNTEMKSKLKKNIQSKSKIQIIDDNWIENLDWSLKAFGFEYCDNCKTVNDSLCPINVSSYDSHKYACPLGHYTERNQKLGISHKD